MGLIVAIDGPAGSGKSSVARAAAERLGLTRVDTGAIYRAVTLVVLEEEADDAAHMAGIACALPLRFEGPRLFLGDREITKEIRSERVTKSVSQVSAIPEVRAELLELQRRLARDDPRGAVLEGRDIGTVVFPDADVKIFMTASPEARARRRHAELVSAGRTDTLEAVLASILERDDQDENRSEAPLRPAGDAIHVDTTDKSFEQVVDLVVRLVLRIRGS